MMKKNFLPFFIAVLSICSNANALSGSDFNAVWKGIEVMGTDHNTANKIREIINLNVDSKFNQDSKELQSWCDKVKDKISGKIECNLIGYQTGEMYYCVEITRINAKKNLFRDIPENSKTPLTLPAEIETLHDLWKSKRMLCFQTIADPQESFKKGYLDYENNIELHNIAVKLNKLTNKYNDLILEILLTSPDAKYRAKAATLLSWANNKNNVNRILDLNLLNDPDPAVRNNLCHSLAHQISETKDRNLISKAIKVFCQQAAMSSHTDRNKAITALVKIFEKHPNENISIDADCKNQIKYIYTMSILPNVGGEAEKLLALIE